MRTESFENVNGKRGSDCPSTCLLLLPLHIYLVVTFRHPPHVLQFWVSPCFCPLTHSDRQYNKLVSSGNHICRNCFTSLPTFFRMNSDAVAIGCPGHTVPHQLLPLAALATQSSTTFHPFHFTTLLPCKRNAD